MNDIRQQLEHVQQQLNDTTASATKDKEALEAKVLEIEKELDQTRTHAEQLVNQYEEGKSNLVREHEETMEHMRDSMEDLRERLEDEKQALEEQLLIKKGEIGRVNKDMDELRESIQVCVHCQSIIESITDKKSL